MTWPTAKRHKNVQPRVPSFESVYQLENPRSVSDTSQHENRKHLHLSINQTLTVHRRRTLADGCASQISLTRPPSSHAHANTSPPNVDRATRFCSQLSRNYLYRRRSTGVRRRRSRRNASNGRLMNGRRSRSVVSRLWTDPKRPSAALRATDRPTDRSTATGRQRSTGQWAIYPLAGGSHRHRSLPSSIKN